MIFARSNGPQLNQLLDLKWHQWFVSNAWNMDEGDQMYEYVSKLDDGGESKLTIVGNITTNGDGSSNGAFFRGFLLVRPHKYDEACAYVERARICLAVELAALELESYERAYKNMVRVQQLSELKELPTCYHRSKHRPIDEGRFHEIRKLLTIFV